MNIYLKILIWVVGTIFVFFISAIIVAIYIGQREMPMSQNKLEFENIALRDTIYNFFAKKVRENGTVSIAIINSDTTQYYGLKREENQLLSFDLHDSIYQIGSISKVFTTSILAKMVYDGDINLNDPIDKYLGYTLNNNYKITFKSLANHTSGLSRMPKHNNNLPKMKSRDPYILYDDQWMENHLKTELIINEKNIGKVKYSNLGMAILGYTLAKIKKLSYDSLYKKYIFSPLQMDSTFITNIDNRKEIIESFDHFGNKADKWVLSSFTPAGGISSNIKDLAKFAIAQMDTAHSFYHISHDSTATNGDKFKVGLGWFIIKGGDGKEYLCHDGATGSGGSGYTSFLAIDKRNKKAVVILTTVSHKDLGHDFGKLALSLIKM